MDRDKRRALEAAGWRFGDTADFLELSEEERREVELRLELCRVIRRQREQQGITQQQLATKLKSSQSRVAKIEAGVGVSLDIMFRALFALGGEIGDLRMSRSKRRAKHVVRS